MRPAGGDHAHKKFRGEIYILRRRGGAVNPVLQGSAAVLRREDGRTGSVGCTRGRRGDAGGHVNLEDPATSRRSRQEGLRFASARRKDSGRWLVTKISVEREIRETREEQRSGPPQSQPPSRHGLPGANYTRPRKAIHPRSSSSQVLLAMSQEQPPQETRDIPI